MALYTVHQFIIIIRPIIIIIIIIKTYISYHWAVEFAELDNKALWQKLAQDAKAQYAANKPV